MVKGINGSERSKSLGSKAWKCGEIAWVSLGDINNGDFEEERENQDVVV